LNMAIRLVIGGRAIGHEVGEVAEQKSGGICLEVCRRSGLFLSPFFSLVFPSVSTVLPQQDVTEAEALVSQPGGGMCHVLVVQDLTMGRSLTSPQFLPSTPRRYSEIAQSSLCQKRYHQSPHSSRGRCHQAVVPSLSLRASIYVIFISFSFLPLSAMIISTPLPSS
jgi:hypothetical protein